nr:MAG TPA: hypothetical protein [Caudoviricetes sp.]
MLRTARFKVSSLKVSGSRKAGYLRPDNIQKGAYKWKTRNKS